MIYAIFWIIGLSIIGICGYAITYHFYEQIGGWFWFIVGVFCFMVTALWMFFNFYYLHWYDHWAWLFEIRSRRGIEFTIFFVGVFCALLQKVVNKRFEAKGIVAAHNGLVLVFILVIPSFIKPILYPVDPSWQEKWERGVCLQTKTFTCGPASTATMLYHFGIITTEEEVSEHTYFSRHGAEPWYLARYIRSKGLEVDFISVPTQPPDPPVPCIAGVKLIKKEGARHYIVVLGKSPNDFIIADPGYGLFRIPKSLAFTQYEFSGFVLHVTRE